MMTHITIVADEHDAETRQARHDWAEVTGTPIELVPETLIDARTGWRYTSIQGAVGYPHKDEPGCMIIAGVQSKPHQRLVILEYREHQSVYDLVSDITVTREKYRHGQHRGILPHWIGDPDRYEAVISTSSVALEHKLGPERGIYIKPPLDWGHRHDLAMYLWQIKSALQSGVLLIRDHPDLSSRLQAVQPDIVDKGKCIDYPTVAMLGGLIHTALLERPWQQDIEQGQPINIED